jgi:hypothetical protein
MFVSSETDSMTAFERAILLLRQSVDLALEAHKLLNGLVFTLPSDPSEAPQAPSEATSGKDGSEDESPYSATSPTSGVGSKPPVPANPGDDRNSPEVIPPRTPPGAFLDDDGTPLSVGMGWYDKALNKMMFYAGPCHKCNRPAVLPFEPRGDRGGWYTCAACYRESRR